jgi:signal transduction histidine kinase/CheY-like chemotaxis protein
MDIADYIDKIVLSLVTKAINHVASVAELRADIGKLKVLVEESNSSEKNREARRGAAKASAEIQRITRNMFRQAAELEEEVARISMDINDVMGSVEDLNAARIRAIEENRSKTSFLARMSHEIRTPMNAIIGMSELAAREYGKPRGREYIAEIKLAGVHLLSLINDILDFSRIETGNLRISAAPYETGSLLNDVLNIIRIRLGDKPIELVADIAPDLPASLTGDETRVRQVLLNILGNAVKYTEKGSIKFTLCGERGTDDSIGLTCIVADSGIGIRREDLPSLFGEFSRVDQSGHIEGAGLGLSIARNLCRAMGGDIAVESEYGKGSVFTLTFSQRIADDRHIGFWKENAFVHAEIRETLFTAPDFRVLIVDDLPTNLKVAEGLLAPYQMEISTCLGGEEAVRLVQKNAYDLVFMDHMMPEMDGLEATRQIRNLDGERFAKLPIIALTANAVFGMKELFLAGGMNDFLSKPIEIDKLNALLETWIPREKRKSAPVEQTHDAVSLAIKIDGLDTAAGLTATGGTEKGYLKVLELYQRDAAERLAFLRDFIVDPLAKPISLFITQAHALKSASASIGAAEISRMAERLEEAGRCSDLRTIREQIDEFCQSLSKVAERIREALDARASETKKDGKAGVDAQTIQKLRQALLLQDVGTVDALMAELRREVLNARTGEVMTKIANAVLLAEYDEALTVLDGLAG